jgi:hypothetical protein
MNKTKEYVELTFHTADGMQIFKVALGEPLVFKKTTFQQGDSMTVDRIGTKIKTEDFK